MNSSVRDLLSGPEEKALATSIEERSSQELIIALVGPVASGVSTSAKLLSEILTIKYGYAVDDIIKASDIIRQEAFRVGSTSIPTEFDRYINHMQTAGNLLRTKFGADYLAEKMVERIVKFRTEKGGIKDGKAIPGRRAYILDSLKNEDELLLLRKLYKETLCVFGVFAPDPIRKRRIVDKKVADADVQRIIERDQGESGTFGQMTRKVFGRSDFFVCNDQKEEALRSKLERFLAIIFETSVHTPTRAEAAMYDASAAGAGSACMSRQVGASIVSAKGELIAIGWNDVPKFGGGLYTEDDQTVYDEAAKAFLDKDNRCFKWRSQICHNDNSRSRILDDIAKQLLQSPLIKKGTSQAAIRSALQGTAVDDLTEYSRSIHAEMEAILSVAREGKYSLVGATLYTTTYPCHNCARHIVASGISKVVYIHPYRKSKAITLHEDAITEDPVEREKVLFSQYDGIAPHLYLRAFTPTGERKSGGKVVNKSLTSATPMFKIPLDALIDYESMIIAELTVKEQTNAV